MATFQSGEASNAGAQNALPRFNFESLGDAFVPTPMAVLEKAQRWNAVGQAMVEEAHGLARAAVEHVEALAGLHSDRVRAMLAGGGLADIAEANVNFACDLLALGATEARRQSASVSRLVNAAWRPDGVGAGA
jgi:hypothetical protein